MRSEAVNGSFIENSAAIYFDFNAPVLTNTVSNMIVKPQVVQAVNVPICDGESYEGIAYQESTVLLDTFNFDQFDSVAITYIEVLPTDSNTISIALCQGDSSPLTGTIFPLEGT